MVSGARSVLQTLAGNTLQSNQNYKILLIT